MATVTSGVQKALDKISAQVQAGNSYEAQQMYKTVYHRYRSRQQAFEAHQVLQEGAIAQLLHGQLACGMELGSLLVEAYVADKVPADHGALDRVYAILEALTSGAQLAPPADEAPGLEASSRFAMAAVKWAHKQGADEAVRHMHDLYAVHVVAAYGWQQLGRAQPHFARGADADAFAAALQQCSSSARPQEAGLFVCRAVLQTLASAHATTRQRQLEHARALLAACLARGLAAGTPLEHFCTMLLQAVGQRSRDLFQLLRVHYAAALAQDPSLDALLSKVESTYYDVPPPGGSGLLGSLLKGLLEADEDE